MSTTKKHLTKEQREVIAAGIADNKTAGQISRSIGKSVSTITREVKKNRSIRERNTKAIKSNPSLRCANRDVCVESGTACKGCQTMYTECRSCKTRNCTKECTKFKLKLCPTTQRWPYVCPNNCAKRGYCGYPIVSYQAADANEGYRERLVDSRSGISLTEEELKEMNDILEPLVKQGQSFEAIWATHAYELPVCERTAYNYLHTGALSVIPLDCPRVVRLKPSLSRRGSKTERTRVDRTDRLYTDFLALPLEEQVRVVQCDSVVGYDDNKLDTLTLHILARKFQLYLQKQHANAAATIALLDRIECALGSPEAFEAIFPILLCDRGPEFDDWAGMERSALKPGKRRTRVFYCDAMESNQKSPAERNHEQLRRILPKGRSNFDALSFNDVVICGCHVNSYPLASIGGKCPFELVEGFIPQALFDEFGYKQLAPDEVILKPYLMRHAVKI